MKTTRKIIDNLKNKIEERKTHVRDLYTEYNYKYAIMTAINEKYGEEPNYLNVNNLPYVG
jgi:hypothetical protein